MKICFLGNSHLAAIKRAWDQRTERSDWEPTFFGAPAYAVDSLRLEEGVLASSYAKVRKSFLLTAGVDHVPLHDQDAFVLAGLTFEFRDFLSVFKTVSLIEHADMRPKRPLLSPAAYAQTMSDLAALRPGSRLANSICEACPDKPIVILASPCPSEAILKDRKFARFATSADDPFLHGLYEAYLAQARALAEVNRWTLVVQPDQTLKAPGLSLETYSANSADVGWTKDTVGPALRGDDWHMNADYGRLVLDDVIKALEASGARA